MLTNQDHCPVYLADCAEYDLQKVTCLLREAFSALGLRREEIVGRKVVIKPNLVMASSPEKAATTHPVFVTACADVLSEYAPASVTLAESPGGPWNAATMAAAYRACRMTEAASDRLKLNQDFTFETVKTDGKLLRQFHCIRPIVEADVIVDLCKLKSHSLTGFSNAVKNLFGIIPGTEKVEMHAVYPDLPDFSEMLVDLAEWCVRGKTFLAVCDAVMAMEGNGPTHGTPVRAGLLLASRSPFTLDVVAAHVMKRDGEVVHLNCSAERGLAPSDWRDVPLLGRQDIPVLEFRRPDSDAGWVLKNFGKIAGGRLAKLLESRPVINRSVCIGCGKCAVNCPQKTIEIVAHGKKRRAKIHAKSCIHCYCCQELCPHAAVNVKQNFIIKLIH